MPYELFLALRYLRSRHKRRLARATAVAAIIGIAMGVGALIVTLALSNGFRDEMRDKILQGTAHINVLRTDGYPLTDSELLKSRIRAVDGVLTASATTYDGAVARGPKASAYAVLRGIEPEAGESMALQSWLFEGSVSARSQPTSEPLAVVGF
jgi:lipoprotein-releasing system permease protein